MAGQKPEIEDLRAGEHGLEMSSRDGHLLLFGCTRTEGFQMGPERWTSTQHVLTELCGD